MNLLAAASGLLFVSVMSAIGGPQLSGVLLPHESRFTAATSGACRMDGDLCPAPGGVSLRLVRGPSGDALHVGRAGTVVTAGAIAPVLEWRGTASSRGFDPHAVIVSLVGREAGPTSRAVIRVRPGEACLIATVAASPGGDAEARLLADERGRSRDCPEPTSVVADASRAPAG